MLLTQLLTNPLTAVIYLASIVIAVSVHEYFHARTADRLGDPTAQSLGRVTLNPKSHLDPIGSLLFLLVGFGWGKPVPYDPYNLKNPRRDSAMIALAGPLSNFVMATCAALMLRALLLFSSPTAGMTSGANPTSWLTGGLLELALSGLTIFISVNIMLGVFNFIPVAPLDGFRIVGGFLPEDQAEHWYSLERYGILILMFIVLPFSGGQSMLQIYVSPVISFLTSFLLPF